MALDAFVAGRYLGTYNAVDVGSTDEGYEIQQESAWENITPSDAWGDSIVDGVYRGGNVHIQFLSKAFKAGSTTPFWPWETIGVMQTYGGAAVTPIGRLASAVAQAMALTNVPGTAYNTTGALVIATLTATKSILAAGFSANILFNSKLRKVPVRLMCLPTEATVSSATKTTWFVTT